MPPLTHFQCPPPHLTPHQSAYVFYVELITDLLHLFVYVVFFIIVFTNYGLPLHLVGAGAGGRGGGCYVCPAPGGGGAG